MSRAQRIIHPTKGILIISILESHFISVGKWEMRIMSTKLSWFATTTYGRRMSSGSSPDVWNVQSGLSALSGMTTLRNTYPAAYAPLSNGIVASRTMATMGVNTSTDIPRMNHPQIDRIIRPK